MTFRLISRTDVGLDPVVRNSDGSPRPKLGFEPWATVHQTGNNVLYRDRPDVPAEIRKIESWAQSQGKPNEYNYVIPIFDDDLVYEYAGPFQAAHSAGENLDAIGILLLNGNNEPITQRQIEKFRWLVSVLQYFAVLSGTCQIVQHYQMPGANTGCAKNVVGDKLPELRLPWNVAPTPTPEPEPVPVPPPPPPPPAPAPAPSDAGLITAVRAGEGWYSIARRVYGTNLTVNSARLQQANPTVTTLKVGQLVAVPGKAV